MADSDTYSARRYKYYEILEISKNVTQEEIKKAFRRLAYKWHPDRNPGNTEAEAKFKKINEAFQVLSNPAERADYDSSPAECPTCWTHHVTEISGNNWRCRHCGRQFDNFGVPLSETIERAAIPERYRVRLAAFQSMQCSWCKRFFTQPFLCPYRLQLHSSCFFFEKLSEEERNRFLDDEKWWWRIIDLVRQTENNGVIKKCVQCGVLNPNPDKLTCWSCGNSIYDLCPSCGLPTLYFDLDANHWRCSNNYCAGKKFAFETVAARRKRESESQDEYSTSNPRQKPADKTRARNMGKKSVNHPIQKWLQALILIFVLSIIGLGISIYIKSFIPFWLLLGFSCIYSVEKWYIYTTYKHRRVGKLYRLFLNLSILSLLGLLVWSGILLFTQQFMQSPLIGSLLFLAELAVFIWLCRVISRNSWRRPSMKLTVFSLICLFFILSFAGVQPLSTYKDSLFNSISTYFRNANQPDTTPSPSDTTPSPSDEINSHTGKYENYYLGLVDTPEGYLSGNGCYDDTGDFIVLINNENAVNPSYTQLVNFLRQDNTDQFPYLYTIILPGMYYGSAESHVNLEHIQNIIDGTTQPSDPHVCGDFAERLHNNAELAGIRCAYVSITLDGNTGHACNAFQTTDRGLVYVDVTGWPPDQPHPDRAVSTVSIVVGRSYTPVSLFHEAGWQDSYVSMGTVTDSQVVWDGSWNN